MYSVQELLDVTTQNNFLTLFNIQLIFVIYLFIFIILFLENAILPAFFLPGDSLLIVIGIFIAKGVLNLFITLGLLTIAVSLGSWMSYLQGKFFKDKKFLQYWLSYLPNGFYQKANYMLNKHGLCALFVGRFLTFIRTILPMIAGVLGWNSVRFQLFNWISAFIWVLILVIIGFCVGHAGSFLFVGEQKPIV